MKKFLFSLLICLSSIPIYAYDVEVDGIYYNIRTDDYEPCAEVTSGDTKYSGSVTIPPTIDYKGVVYPVKGIGQEAFRDCATLTSLTISNKLTYILHAAFYGCTELASLIVDSGGSFDSRDNCNAIISTSANKLILGCKNTVIPNSVTSIDGGAFWGCSGLTSIEIPNSVTSIGNGAFEGCSGLTSIDIPNSVTSIGSNAFQDCSALTSVTIPDSLTSITDGTFAYCSSLISITIPNGVTSIGSGAFFSCM